MPISLGIQQNQRKKIVFLGTPVVAARALEILLEAEQLYQVVAVVSQPPTRAPRGGASQPSPVHALALARGIPVLAPESAKDTGFLSDLAALAPDLCVTAAYGNVLPDSFLALPAFGTLNIHPSLLPLYRGAAPVQRTLEAGATETGVSVAFTVKAMDAGPILAQPHFAIDPDIKAPQLLLQLFELGAKTLVEYLPQVFAKTAKPWEQDATQATKAKKLSIEEGFLDFSQSATVLHNRVRAFAPWPGTRALLRMEGLDAEFKVISTRLGKTDFSEAPNAVPEAATGKDAIQAKDVIVLQDNALFVHCDDGSTLEILELQAPGKRVVSARDFWNGLKVKDLRRTNGKVQSNL